ncbi:MAG TPA: hypothetical protein VK099_01815 [Alcanivoracaceae bacterium]|nr:hypothetical protein [Alcanivoracaceae bacterium]
MKEFLTWIVDNQHWLFSGVGLVVFAWIGRFFFRKRHASPTQTIRSGDGSINIQANRNVNFGVKKDSDEEAE